MPDVIQRVLAAAILICVLPILALLAVIVRMDSPGPSLYRAPRVGRGGRTFTCLKFRTMTWTPAFQGAGVTAYRDRRTTRVGRHLRRYRFDELPQLVNVVHGDLRLVGPRPEDPRFVDLSVPEHRTVFTATPGITGLTQLFYLDEEQALRGRDPERTYRDVVLPGKLKIDARYLANRSTVLDLRILAATITALLGTPPDPGALDRWAPRRQAGAESR